MLKNVLWNLKKFKIKLKLQKKIKHIRFKRDKEFEAKCKRYWSSLGMKKYSVKWASMYSEYSTLKDIRYIPEYLYYCYIEPRLNIKYLNYAYTDKSFYSTLISDKYLIPNLVECSNFTYTNMLKDNDLDNLFTTERLIFKPSIDSGGGSGITIVENRKDYELSLETYYHSYGNFVVQKVVRQHAYFAAFNQTSLNTIRCFVYRSPIDNQSYILNSVLRVGKKGSFVDNQASGGLVIGISNGEIGSFCISKYGMKSSTINDLALQSVPKKIPHWDEFEQVAKHAVTKFRYAKLLGVDLCLLDSGEVKIVEVNCFNNEINFFQMTNGPLLGEKTEEIILLCKKRKVNFVLRG